MYRKNRTADFVILSILLILSSSVTSVIFYIPQQIAAQLVASSQASTTSNSSTSKNSTLIIHPPSNWIVSKGNNIIRFYSPPRVPNSYFELSVKNITMPTTLAHLINLQKKSISSWANITASNTTTVAHNPAYKIVYTFKKGIYIEMWMQLLTIKDDKEFIIRYVGQPLLYSKYLPIVQHMIDTASFVGGSAPPLPPSGDSSPSSNQVIPGLF